MSKLNYYFKRLENPATIIGICGYLLSIMACMGIAIDNEVIMKIIQGICGICVLLGIMNNPETKGIDVPKFHKQK